MRQDFNLYFSFFLYAIALILGLGLYREYFLFHKSLSLILLAVFGCLTLGFAVFRVSFGQFIYLLFFALGLFSASLNFYASALDKVEFVLDDKAGAAQEGRDGVYARSGDFAFGSSAGVAQEGRGGVYAGSGDFAFGTSAGVAQEGRGGVYTLRIIGEPKLSGSGKTYKVNAEFCGGGEAGAVGANLRGLRTCLYIEATEAARVLKIGDICKVQTRFRLLEKSEYAKYMQNRNIYISAYVNKFSWQKIGSSFSLRQKAIELRGYLAGFFDKNLKDVKERGLVKALVLGDKSELDPEINRQYRDTGVVHILCVSGMHLGIFAYVLSKMLSFIKNRRYRWVKFIIMLAMIWLYAFVAALTPSICRAAIMFSLLHLSTVFSQGAELRASKGIRCLVLSAWIQIILSPVAILDLGFALSHLAVWGIMYFRMSGLGLSSLGGALQKKKRIWNTAHKKVVDILSVSFAAQAATSPISLLYFGKFPTYFFVSNLFVSPLSSIVLPLGIFSSVFQSFSEYLNHAMASLLGYGLRSMNYTVAAVDSLPKSIICISVSPVVCVFIYLMLVYLRRAVAERKSIYLKYSALFLLGVVIAF